MKSLFAQVNQFTFPTATCTGVLVESKGTRVKECSCSASAIARYQKRISGPLLDRIDIYVEVPRVDYEKLADKRNVENSETIRKRVQAARERQLQRFVGTKLTYNPRWVPPKSAISAMWSRRQRSC